MLLNEALFLFEESQQELNCVNIPIKFLKSKMASYFEFDDEEIVKFIF